MDQNKVIMKTLSVLFWIPCLLGSKILVYPWSIIPLFRGTKTHHGRPTTTTTTTATTSRFWNEDDVVDSMEESRTEDAAQRIYSLPELYDLAFGYRDFEEETNFLLNQHWKVSGFEARRILDVAAGPARHGIVALHKTGQNVTLVTCIDSSLEMSHYAQKKLASQEQLDSSGKTSGRFQYIVDDMKSFRLDPEFFGENSLFDTAWILLGSLQHLTKNSEVVQCFSSIHQYLKSKGTLILELPHPRETFCMMECTRNEWRVPLDDNHDHDDDQDEEEESLSGELEIIWGDDDDFFDPISQVRQLSIEMKLHGPQQQQSFSQKKEIQSVKGVVPTRLFTAQEIEALATLAGFQLHSMYGALQEGVSIHDEDAAFRLICVLQKE